MSLRPTCLAALAFLFLVPGPGRAWERGAPQAIAPPVGPPALLAQVGVEERLGERIPLDLPFADAGGRPVRLARYFDGRRPVVLALVYYDCPALCSLVQAGLARAMRQSGLSPGRDFQAVSASFDPAEKPPLAAERQRGYLEALGQPGATDTWAFLTGEEPSIRALAGALGFRYARDPATRQWAHVAAVYVFTPGGVVSRYLYGVEIPGRDLRLALLEASGGRIGTTLDRVLLTCYRYDPQGHRYAPYALGFVRLGGAAVLLALGGLLAVLWTQERKRRRP